MTRDIETRLASSCGNAYYRQLSRAGKISPGPRYRYLPDPAKVAENATKLLFDDARWAGRYEYALPDHGDQRMDGNCLMRRDEHWHGSHLSADVSCPRRAVLFLSLPPNELPGLDVPHYKLCAGDVPTLVSVDRRITERRPDAQIEVFGAYLFDALIGSSAWAAIREAAARASAATIELAMACDPDDKDFHRLNWEMMHDGLRFIAAGAEVAGRTIPVAITRVMAGPLGHPSPGRLAAKGAFRRRGVTHRPPHLARRRVSRVAPSGPAGPHVGTRAAARKRYAASAEDGYADVPARCRALRRARPRGVGARLSRSS